ncbi:NAD(P)H-binding protein [Endozoicomonas numazuensis]|uniref:NADH dehydrogenase n=1 Tax=Endozoicomonas numazuensis TaxID=1137799 RepID=A0A081NJQ4_9GAMM|nr:NAD(P)H-binding protein [Endozoicomonas numazuensis]KEQ18677.1 NADH dehydrogenase [Endozoicomonas numazuensis]
MLKTAVIIGATGLVGSELLDQLLESPDIEKVVALARREVQQTSDKLESHIIDFKNLEQSRDLIKGDLFFSCLGTTKKQAGSIDAQRQIDFDYQWEAARIAAENNVPHYLLISSSGANAQSHSQYFKMKGELEQAIKQLPFQNVSIFQPSLLLGKRRENRLGEGLAAKVLPCLCQLPGLRKLRPIHDWELAGKMLKVATKERADGVSTYTLDEIFQ